LYNYRANAGTDLEQALRGQLRNYFVRGVGVDFHGFAERANGWKGIAGAQLAGDHGLLGGKRHLFVDRNAGLRSQPEWNHGFTTGTAAAGFFITGVP
jgi:hypothetical protein